MSIINEALKKTEESIQKNSVKENSGQNKKPKLKPYLFYFLIFIVGLFLSSLIFMVITRKIEPPVISEPAKIRPISNKEPETSQPLPDAAVANLTEEEIKPEKNFILNGIFYSGNNGYALVNNQIIKENDSVDGAQVEKITANSVELNNEGKIITLSTNR